MRYEHYSVLLKEAIDLLDVKKGCLYVDGTFGGGGHSKEIAKRGGEVLGIDRDDAALENAKKLNIKAVKGNFADIDNLLDNLNIDKIDGAVLDLGVSSHQLDEADRGFSYRFDAPLDMRMDKMQEKSAYQVINEYDEKEISEILKIYGEEKFAGPIARKIMQNRPIATTLELVDVIKKAVPPKDRYSEKKHPAKRTFQAIRIEVNDELGSLKKAIYAFANRLNKNGNLAIITFHSLEDRIVKKAFEELSEKKCICPKNFPVCACGAKDAKFELINKKPIVPSNEELEENKRSQSAKLRGLKKI